MKGYPVIIILIIFLFFSGCTGGNQKGRDTLAPIITQVPSGEGTPEVSSPVSVPSQAYKTTNLVISAPNTYPVYGFTMDYPSEWSYKQEHSRSWRAGYNFSSPDDKSYVYVYVDDTSGSAYYWYNLTKWADNLIRARSFAYCHDNNGRPISCTPERTARDYYYLTLTSNEPVTISGSFEARKLIFKSNNDRYFGQDTYYIMHAGTMQRYNFTVPDHYEVGVKVNGPAYDYGVGGQGYIIDLYASPDQVDATSEIFDHMIKSFKVTS
jgi:hypothetical protein